MKLAFAIHADLRNGRGSEKVLLNLLKFRPDWVNVTILETDYMESQRISDDILSQVTKESNIIKIHRNVIGKNQNKILNIIINNIIIRSYILDKKRISENEIFDAIEENDVAFLFSNFFAIYFDKSKMPVIGSNHSIDPTLFFSKNIFKRIFYRTYLKIYFKNINGYQVFPKNKQMLKNLESSFGMKYNMVLPNGVDTYIFKPDITLKNDKLKVFYVAYLSKAKGLDILLPLIKKLKNNKGIEFHIAGAGPWEERVKTNKNIIYHGVVGDNELASLYRESDIFIYPSRDDYFGLVVLEALSSGLYVLCGNYLKGNFDDFEGKYLEYIEMDVDAFYNRLMEILENIEYFHHDKAQEYNAVKQKCDWEVISQNFYKAIEQIQMDFIIDQQKKDYSKQD